jgi:hypothetical protein
MRVAQVPAHSRLAGPARLAVAVEVLTTYAGVRLRLRRSDVRAVLAALRRADGSRPAAHDAVATGRRLGRAVVRTLEVLPTDTRCLMRSLVLTRMLARRGIATRLVIAVRPGGSFAAHAWVEHDGIALLPAEAPSFEQLVTL